jgi:hypothetical protein
MKTPQPVTKTEVDVAWRLFLLNWIPLGVMGVALALSIVFTDFSIKLPGLAFSLGFVAVYAGFAHANARSAIRRDPQVMFALGGTAQIVLVTVLMTPLTYVAAATSFPLQDANLLAADRALGFDWTAYVGFVNDHPTLARWLTIGYAMIRWPIFAIPVVLAAAYRYRRMEEFILAFGLALIVTTIISAFVPALGIYFELPDVSASYSHVAPVAYFDSARELPLVRDGSIRQLDLTKLTGLVTFPSFHAASAALYTWALWPVRWIRPIIVIANGAMLASCPVDGAHYIVDLIAGIAIAALAIMAARWISLAITRQQTAGATGAPMSRAAVPAE